MEIVSKWIFDWYRARRQDRGVIIIFSGENNQILPKKTFGLFTILLLAL
jgi:hypothetical protein